MTDKERERKRIWNQWLLDNGLLKPDIVGVAWTDRLLDLYAFDRDCEGEFTKADLRRIQADLWKQAGVL